MSLTVAAALRDAARRLDRSGIERGGAEARLLLGAAAGLEPASVLAHPERPLTGAQSKSFDAAVARRAAREPLSRILGQREFWSLTLEVSADTLDPRPDTETVVEAALRLIEDSEAPLQILDLGTGTGCLLLALLDELPNARGLGIDIASGAVAIAQRNARRLGFEGRASFALGNWGVGLDRSFDLIVSNPPYIPTSAIATLDPEVARFDPRRALDGGDDGLTCYRALVGDLPRLLRAGGSVVLEVGTGQAGEVEAILSGSGLVLLGRRRDLAGHERCVLARAL